MSYHPTGPAASMVSRKARPAKTWTAIATFANGVMIDSREPTLARAKAWADHALESDDLVELVITRDSGSGIGPVFYRYEV